MEIFVTVLLLTVTAAQGSQLEGPQNAVSVVGSNVTLKCLSPSKNCSGIDWIKYRHGSPKTVFRDSGGISIAYRGRYSVKNNSSGCDLIIKNVELTDAGCFLCRAIFLSRSVEKTAYLIILENQSKCMTNASEDKTAEGDVVHLTCEVTYNGTNRASMVWKGVNGTPVTVTNGKTISRSDSVVSSAPEVPSFTCNTSFSVEINSTQITGLATNSLVATCETPAIKILYSVRNVTLSPSLSYYSSGNVISCTAKGHPSPTFKWQEMENGSIWVDIRNQNGSVFNVNDVSSKRYRCVAMNVVRGRSYSATSHEFLVNNTGSDSVRNVTLWPSLSVYVPGGVINCTAKGYPSPTLKWQELEKDGTWMDIQNQNGSQFTMTNVSSKRYRCVAMNVVRGKSYNATSHEFQANDTGSDYSGNFTATTMSSLPSTVGLRVAVGAAVGFLLLITLLIICFCVRVCPGYRCCHSENKSKDSIRDEQPLPENPDTCIYSVVNKKQNAHPKAKIGLASTSESPKLPHGATPQAMPRTDKSKDGHTNTYQHEEVTYADLAMEFGPRKVVPKYNPELQETLYAAVGAA